MCGEGYRQVRACRLAIFSSLPPPVSGKAWQLLGVMPMPCERGKNSTREGQAKVHPGKATE